MKKLFLIAITLLLVQFARAQWEPDVRLTDTPDTSYTFYGMGHSIASSGDTVHVVWRDKSPGNWEIFYKRSIDDGLNWEQDTRITYDEARSGHPSISLSGPVVHVVWTDTRDGNYEIYYNRSIDGGSSWEGETRLTDDLSYSYESVVSASGSDVHVVWVSVFLDDYYQIFYKRSTDGGITWGAETWLSGNSEMAYNPSIGASGSDVHVVWNDNRDGNLEIYYLKSSDNGLTWRPEIRLTDDPATSNLPSIAVSGSSVHIAWNDFRDGYGGEIYYKGSVDGGENWGDDIRITNDPGNSISSNLAVSNSVLHVVWQDYRSGFSDIFYNYSTDGGETWATDTQLNDFSYSSQRPFIAVSDPVLHVIWYDYRDFNYEIYYKQNPTGGVFVGLENELLNNSGQQISIFPNPAGKQLTVRQSLAERSDVPTLSGSVVKLSIFDLFGREVKAIANVRSFPYQLDISDLPDGVYILKMTDNLGNAGAVKFLKLSD